MRLAGRLRMGHFALALAEALRIRRFLALPDESFPAVDPCAECGTAFVEIATGANAVRYGAELDAYRAEAARRVLSHVIQGSCFDVHCPVEFFSLAFLRREIADRIMERFPPLFRPGDPIPPEIERQRRKPYPAQRRHEGRELGRQLFRHFDSPTPAGSERDGNGTASGGNAT